MRIPLGTVVKDKVTGFIGVAESRGTYLYGCDRYCIQPKIANDGKMPESKMIDEPQLEIVEGEELVMSPAGEPKQLVELGQFVLDPARDMEGTVMGRAVYLNGCSRLYIQPKQKGEKERKAWWVDEPQVEPQQTFLKEVKKAEKRTGGPALCSTKY